MKRIAAFLPNKNLSIFNLLVVINQHISEFARMTEMILYSTKAGIIQILAGYQMTLEVQRSSSTELNKYEEENQKRKYGFKVINPNYMS